MSPSCPLRISYFGPTSKSSLFCNMINQLLTRPPIAQIVDSTIRWITQLVFVILSTRQRLIRWIALFKMAGYWPSIKNKAQKTDVTFFRPLSLPGSLLQNKVLIVQLEKTLFFQCLVDINDCNQVGTMCLVAIYHLRSNTCSWDQMSVKYKNALKTRPQLFKHWITVSTR